MANEYSSAQILDDEGDFIGISCTLDIFGEFDEIEGLINRVSESCENDTLCERGCQLFKKIMDQYQMQPHLLDSYLPTFISSLVEIITKTNQQKARELACEYFYMIVKVRSYKIVMKKLPHEVKNLLPVLKLLEDQCLEKGFYGKYILLMWLSIIIYMPFNLHIFDNSLRNLESSEKYISISERLFNVVKKNLSCAQSSRDMAAFLASRLVTRPDLQKEYLPAFFQYSFQVLENSNSCEISSLFHKLGILRSLGFIFKHGKREELLVHSNNVLNRLLSQQILSSINDPLKKLFTKVIQRIGLTFLKPKLAEWRYSRGGRSLKTNSKKLSSVCVENVEDNSEEIPDEGIEDVIEYLFTSLRDQDTVVRWSAAKGIGRICNRLSKSLADDVIIELLDVFSPRETDKGWHGGCLALAELARRGLLLPEKLEIVLPILNKALTYDELRGTFSIGTNIRDAACYLSWAFARAYDSAQLKPFVREIATDLLIVALFDRDVSCRKAAAAAFQEHVGRQGNFPHGIEILTTVDYFSVGNRVNAFLNLCLVAAKHEEYTGPFISHLVDRKITHWDASIRELAARALHNLTELSPQKTGEEVLPQVLEICLGPVLLSRHGALLSAAYIIEALSRYAVQKEKNISEFISPESVKSICEIVPTLRHRGLFKGMGGEYMRRGCAVLIEKCSVALEKNCVNQIYRPYVENDGENFENNLDFCDERLLKEWHSLLECNVLDYDEAVREPSLTAIQQIWINYFKNEQEWSREICEKYTKSLTSCATESKCLGYAALLGHMPQHLLRVSLKDIINSLIQSSKIQGSKESWALVRKEAIVSIEKICSTVGISQDKENTVTVVILKDIYSALHTALDDYTMDRRGDIGAWVREASIDSLLKITLSIFKNSSVNINQEILNETITRICQQCVERIDRTRMLAGQAFHKLIYFNNVSNNVENTKFPDLPTCNTASSDNLKDVRNTNLTDLTTSNVFSADLKNLKDTKSANNSPTCNYASSVNDTHSELKIESINRIPDIDKIRTIFPYDWCKNCNWRAEKITFPKFVNLLDLPMYRPRVLLGITYALGGVSAYLSRFILESLQNYLNDRCSNREILIDFFSSILTIFEQYEKNDRIIVPLIKSLADIFACCTALDQILTEEEKLLSSLLTRLKIECLRCNDFKKLSHTVSTLCELLRLESKCAKDILFQLSVFLGYPFPKVREVTASSLLTAINDYEEIIPTEASDQVVSILEQTIWAESLEIARSARNQINILLGLQVPKKKI